MKIKIIIIALTILLTNIEVLAHGRHNHGKNIRVYNQKEFTVRDSAKIIVYSRDESKTIMRKTTETHYETVYYFSKAIDSEIWPLTVINIEKAFPEDHKMHDALMKTFHDDTSLTEYDEFHKTFKVNRFLLQNLNSEK